MRDAILKFQIFDSKRKDESYLKQYMSIKHHLYSAEWKYCHKWRDPLDDGESLKFQQDLTGDLKKEISINIPNCNIMENHYSLIECTLQWVIILALYFVVCQ